MLFFHQKLPLKFEAEADRYIKVCFPVLYHSWVLLHSQGRDHMTHSHLPWMSGQTQVQTLEVKTGFTNPPSCWDLKEELSITC